MKEPSLPHYVIVRIERDPGTRQWPSVDSPSTAVRRYHLSGVYCRNPLDHLPFLNKVTRFDWIGQYQPLHGLQGPVAYVSATHVRIIYQIASFGKTESDVIEFFSESLKRG